MGIKDRASVLEFLRQNTAPANADLAGQRPHINTLAGTEARHALPRIGSYLRAQIE